MLITLAVPTPSARPPAPAARLCLLPGLVLALALLAPAASAQLADIDEIAVTSGPAYLGGSFTDFFVDPIVAGVNIDRVLLSSGNGALVDVEMVETTPDEFACDEEIPVTQPCENFQSLAAVRALGDLIFEIRFDNGQIDTVTVPLALWDPGLGQSGFPQINVPGFLQTGVATSVVTSWNPAPAWVQLIEASLEEKYTGFFTDEDLFFGAPPFQTSWDPSGVANSTVYDFDLSFFQLIEELELTSPGGREYDLITAFESFNRVVFQTVPEPGFATLLAAGLVGVAGLGRRRAASRDRVRL